MAITMPVRNKDKYLEELLSHIKDGEEVILTKDNEPIARIIPILPYLTERIPGSAKGQIKIMPDFDEPLPEDILDTFES